MTVTAPFLLVNPDFSKTEVVKAYAHTIVAPAIDYWKQTIEGKKRDQLERMKTVCIFNPLHVLGNKISESDIDGLKKFKFYEHPEERKDSKGKDCCRIFLVEIAFGLTLGFLSRAMRQQVLSPLSCLSLYGGCLSALPRVGSLGAQR